MKLIGTLPVFPPTENKIYEVKVLCDYNDAQNPRVLEFFIENRRRIEIFAGDHINNLPIGYPFKIEEGDFNFLLSL